MELDLCLLKQENHRLRQQINSVKTLHSRILAQAKRLHDCQSLRGPDCKWLVSELVELGSSLQIQRQQKPNSITKKQQQFVAPANKECALDQCLSYKQILLKINEALKKQIEQLQHGQKIASQTIRFQEEQIIKLRHQSKHCVLQLERIRQNSIDDGLPQCLQKEAQEASLKCELQSCRNQISELQVKLRASEDTIDQLIQTENTSKAQVRDLTIKLEVLLHECEEYQSQLNRYRIKILQQKNQMKEAPQKNGYSSLRRQLLSLREVSRGLGKLSEGIKDQINKEIITTFTVFAENLGIFVEKDKKSRTALKSNIKRVIDCMSEQNQQLKSQLIERRISLANSEDSFQKENVCDNVAPDLVETDYVNKKERIERSYRLLKQRESKLKQNYEFALERVAFLERELQEAQSAFREKYSEVVEASEIERSHLRLQLEKYKLEVSKRKEEFNSLKHRLGLVRGEVEATVQSIFEDLQLLERRKEVLRPELRVKLRK